jgi:hypothetical protein
MIQRSDVVIMDVPFTDAARSKARPAIVVQNDRDNRRLRKPEGGTGDRVIA